MVERASWGYKTSARKRALVEARDAEFVLILLRLEPHLNDELVHRSEELGVSRQETIRKALRRYLAK